MRSPDFSPAEAGETPEENTRENTPQDSERFSDKEKGEINLKDYPPTPEGNVKLILAHESGNRVSVDDFGDIYGAERVLGAKEDEINILEHHYRKFEKSLDEHVKDIEDPEEREAKRKKIREVELAKQRRGEALEAILGEQVEMSDWFGEHAYAVRTAKYDDLKNGVDMILEFEVPDLEDEGKEERVALSVDISMNSPSVIKKVERNLDKVLAKGGAKVEFFSSRLKGGFKGELRNVIPIAIGIDGANATNLFERAAQRIRLNESIKRTKDPNIKNALEKRYNDLCVEDENSPVQVAYLNEMLGQIVMYWRALKGRPEHADLRKEVKKLYGIFAAIRESKGGIKLGELKNDTTYRSIVDTAKAKFK